MAIFQCQTEVQTIRRPRRHISSVCAIQHPRSLFSCVAQAIKFHLCASKRSCLDTLMHFTDTFFFHPDTTVDIDDTQATISDDNNPSAHSRLRSMFGYFAEHVLPTQHTTSESGASSRSSSETRRQGRSTAAWKDRSQVPWAKTSLSPRARSSVRCFGPASVAQPLDSSDYNSSPQQPL